MDNIEEILFNMVKQAVLKAIGHVSIISMLLILPTVIPCYLFLSNPDGGDSSTNFSGKVGGSVAATDKVDVYGEFSIVTDTTNSYGTKLGLKYKF